MLLCHGGWFENGLLASLLCFGGRCQDLKTQRKDRAEQGGINFELGPFKTEILKTPPLFKMYLSNEYLVSDASIRVSFQQM